jgi:hypothetical protein
MNHGGGCAFVPLLDGTALTAEVILAVEDLPHFRNPKLVTPNESDLRPCSSI